MNEPTTIYRAHDSYVLSVRFAPDGRYLVSTGMDNVAKVWSVPFWELVATLEGHEKSVNAVALSPDGSMAATSSSDQTVRLWSFPEGKPLHILQDRKQVVSCVDISADGQWLVAGFYGGRAVVWTLEGRSVLNFKASSKNLSSAVFSPDASLLATSGLGDDIQLWDLPAGHHRTTLSGHRTAVDTLRFIEEGRTLVSVGHEQSIKFWDTATWQETRSLRSRAPGVRGLAFSSDEMTLALAVEGGVQLWSAVVWTVQAEFPVSTKVVNSVSFSPDGRWLAAGGADGRMRVWTLV